MTKQSKMLMNDDVFGLLDAMDEKKLISSLPKFVAHDPAKLPPFKTEDLDVCLLTLRVAALEEQLATVVSQCVDAVKSFRHVDCLVESHDCETLSWFIC